MLKLSLWRTIATLCLALVVSACGGAGSSASAPSNFKVTPGNGQVIITWQADSGVDYWMMYAASAAAIDIKNPPPGHIWATNITSPYVVSGLTNGTTYSFAINGRTSGGPGGPQTASQSAVPRAAGSTWLAGTTTLGSGEMRGVAYGTASDTTVNYVAVGASGAIYKGLEGVSQSLTGMVWSQVSTTPAIDFKAATYISNTTFSKFVAVGANGPSTNIYSSADMASWTPATTLVGASLNAVTNNGTTLVAVGNGGSIFYSTDALVWTASNALPGGATPNLYGVAYSYSTGLWVTVGAGGALFTSTNLSDWTLGNSGVTDNLNSIAATSGNVLVAVGDNGTVITNSTTTAIAGGGGTWAVQTVGTALSNTLYAVSTDLVQFVAVGQGGKAYTSTNGTTWSAAISTSTGNSLFAVVGSASKYVAVGASGANTSSIN